MSNMKDVLYALTTVVEAWEELGEGYYTPEAIEDWVNGPMKEAIEEARAVLKECK